MQRAEKWSQDSRVYRPLLHCKQHYIVAEDVEEVEVEVVLRSDVIDVDDDMSESPLLLSAHALLLLPQLPVQWERSSHRFVDQTGGERF